MRPMDAFGPSEPSTENQSYPDAAENEAAQCSSGSNFRVRGVSEINDAEDSDFSKSCVKRKHCTEDLENEINIDKKSKNIKPHSNDEDATDSIDTNKELQHGGKENPESYTEKNKNVTPSERVCHFNGSVLNDKNGLISSAEDNKTLEENVKGKDNDPAGSTASSTECVGDQHESINEDDPCTSSSGALEKVKAEPTDTDNSKDHVGTSTLSTIDIKPTLNVKKEEATSTSRESCKYGIRCYRRNPMHRIEEAHPGDHDYKRPNFPLPPSGTPDCPFGDSCYRRNPTHFQQFTHPPETDFEQNWKNIRMRLRQRRQQTQNNLNSNNSSDHSSDLDDYDLEDPFIDDEILDQDYEPSDNDDEEEYDECDKAEE